jgi:hypothetical protein
MMIPAGDCSNISFFGPTKFELWLGRMSFKFFWHPIWKIKNLFKKKIKYPRLMTVRAVDPEYKYPFNNGDVVLVTGEIDNMPGHFVIVTRDGKVHFGYHPEHFREPTDGEI